MIRAVPVSLFEESASGELLASTPER